MSTIHEYRKTVAHFNQINEAYQQLPLEVRQDLEILINEVKRLDEAAMQPDQIQAVFAELSKARGEGGNIQAMARKVSQSLSGLFSKITGNPRMNGVLQKVGNAVPMAKLKTLVAKLPEPAGSKAATIVSSIQKGAETLENDEEIAAFKGMMMLVITMSMGALGVGGPAFLGIIGSAAIFRTVVDTAIKVAAGGTVADAAKTAGAGLVKGAIAGAIGAGIAAAANTLFPPEIATSFTSGDGTEIDFNQLEAYNATSIDQLTPESAAELLKAEGAFEQMIKGQGMTGVNLDDEQMEVVRQSYQELQAKITELGGDEALENLSGLTGQDLEQAINVNYSQDFGSYEVQQGDNLSMIANNNNVSVEELVDANPDIADLNNLQPGQEINIPVASDTTTYAGGVGTDNPDINQDAIDAAQDNPMAQDYDGDGDMDAVAGQAQMDGPGISAAELKQQGLNLDTVQELGPDAMEQLEAVGLTGEQLEQAKAWLEIEKALDVEKFMGQDINASQVLDTSYGPVAQQSLDSSGATVDSFVMKGTSAMQSKVSVTLPGMDKPLEGFINYQIESNGAVEMASVSLQSNPLGDWVEGLTPEQMDALYAIEDMPAGLTDVTQSVDTTAQNIFKALAIPAAVVGVKSSDEARKILQAKAQGGEKKESFEFNKEWTTVLSEELGPEFDAFAEQHGEEVAVYAVLEWYNGWVKENVVILEGMEHLQEHRVIENIEQVIQENPLGNVARKIGGAYKKATSAIGGGIAKVLGGAFNTIIKPIMNSGPIKAFTNKVQQMSGMQKPVDVDTLNQEYQAAGSPTDSAEIEKFLRDKAGAVKGEIDGAFQKAGVNAQAGDDPDEEQPGGEQPGGEQPGGEKPGEQPGKPGKQPGTGGGTTNKEGGTITVDGTEFVFSKGKWINSETGKEATPAQLKDINSQKTQGGLQSGEEPGKSWKSGKEIAPPAAGETFVLDGERPFKWDDKTKTWMGPDGKPASKADNDLISVGRDWEQNALPGDKKRFANPATGVKSGALAGLMSKFGQGYQQGLGGFAKGALKKGIDAAKDGLQKFRNRKAGFDQDGDGKDDTTGEPVDPQAGGEQPQGGGQVQGGGQQPGEQPAGEQPAGGQEFKPGDPVTFTTQAGNEFKGTVVGPDKSGDDRFLLVKGGKNNQQFRINKARLSPDAGAQPAGGEPQAQAPVDANKDGKDDKTGQPVQPEQPGQAQGGTPLTGQDHRQLGALQTKASQGDTASAKGLVTYLSGKLEQGADPKEISQYANAASTLLKRNKAWVQQNQQLYTHLVKLARGMRVEAYDHISRVLEHAGLTWEDLGYRVAVTENQVILFPSAEFAQLEESVALQEMKTLAGF